MLFSRGLRQVVLAGLLLSVMSVLPISAQTVPDFAFIHASDVHAPLDLSARVIAEMKNLGEVELTPYNVKAKPPSFVVVSGDVTEFGGGGGVWDTYMSYWDGLSVPVYHQLGNHDGPWYSNRPYLRKLYGGCSWSFDQFGCHFIGLDDSIPHDPRANVTQEQLAWLKEDLKRLDPETPVFLVIHHPVNDTYFGSPYASAQFLDLLRPYNLVAVLMGHGHSANMRTNFGVDNIQGGSTMGPPAARAGFNVVSIQNGMLRVAYKLDGQSAATQAVIEKPMPSRSAYPEIRILSPSEKTILRRSPLVIRARISGNEKPIVSATWMLDNGVMDEKRWDGNPMECRGRIYHAESNYADWTPGAHYLQVTFTDEAGAKFTKCVRFGTEPAPSRLLWREFLGGSCRGTATVAGNTVYVGATDMKLYALNKKTGYIRWSYLTGGDVCTKPLVVEDTVYFGSGDGSLYAVGTNGKLKWTFPAKAGIYSSPVFAEGLVLFGCNDSNFYAVDAKTGQQAWVLEDPEYSIEIKPFVDNGVVYFGAWDQYVYAVDVKTGKLVWKCLGTGSATQPGAKRYYSPADCGPVASSGKVFVADRNSQLSIIDAAAGTVTKSENECVAIGISEDGKAVYERKPGVGLSKIDLDGNQIWKADADAGSVPAAPVEKDGVVYVVSNLGLVQAFNAADGKPLWTYRATPLLYVMSEVEVADGVVYVSGMDGTVTAIKAK